MTWRVETTEPGLTGEWVLFRNEDTKAAITVLFLYEKRVFEKASARANEAVRDITEEDYAKVIAACIERL